MANLVRSKSEFNGYKIEFLNRFLEKGFDQNPFKEYYNYFLGFEFDFIFHKSFFDGLKVFLGKIGDSSVVFYTIDPSADKYFFHYFGNYSVFEISSDATDEELNEILTLDPGDSPADALCTNSNEIAWYSSSKEWAIIGSRDWEIAIVGFTSTNIKDKFVKSFDEDAQTMFTTIQVQAKTLDEMLNFNEEGKTAYENLVHNYQDRT